MAGRSPGPSSEHLEIIYEMNRRFLEAVRWDYPDGRSLRRGLLIQEGSYKDTHAPGCGSHAVMVAGLHAILKNSVFRAFADVSNRIVNVRNGITPPSLLIQANPVLHS